MIALINPNLIVQRNDPFTTGIVYMPLSLAYVAAALREAQIPLEVIDAYAQNPAQARRRTSRPRDATYCQSSAPSGARLRRSARQ